MSIEVTEAVDAQALAGFDAIIDVRSPGEFAEDHIPGAENLPVLDDAERAEVGAIYVQQSRFLARRIGAAHVARNIARHLEGALADRPGSFHPLIYCWRGGQRSNAMATILSQVGWRVTLLTGGYKTYRRAVKERLYDREEALPFVLLDGHTGSAKTGWPRAGCRPWTWRAWPPTADLCSAPYPAARSPARSCSKASSSRRWTPSTLPGPSWSRPSPARSGSG
jgi:tRNA 2-selenouridine synthase